MQLHYNFLCWLLADSTLDIWIWLSLYEIMQRLLITTVLHWKILLDCVDN